MRWIPHKLWLIEILIVASLFTATSLMVLYPNPALAMQGAPTPPTTQLADTIYHADGTPATGTVLVSWPAFTTSTGAAIPAGNTAVTIATGGQLNLALVPNAGSNPMGSYYTAVYHLDDGTISREYWVVPVSTSPVTIASIKSTVLPASVALQTVTKSYVDNAIANAVTGGSASGYIPASGGTMTGPLVLPGDPIATNQAADKHYVDASVAAVSGGTIAASRLPLFGPSGASHAPGAVPDPGATAGATRYLREDGTWSLPVGGNGSSSTADITSGTIDGAIIGGVTPAAGAFTTVIATTPIAVASGGTGTAIPPAAGQLLVGNPAGTAFAPKTLSGDCTLSAAGSATCTKTNGVAFGSAATTAATAYDPAGAATTAAAAVQTASLQKSSNLSDLASAATARSNLGLGTAATHGASISINGSACPLDGACTAFSFATLPQQSNVLADYQLNDGSGTTPADSSGNGNTGSFPASPAAPTWTNQGLACNGTAGGSGTTGQYFTTAGTQNAKSIMMVYTITPPGGSNQPSYPYFYTLWGNSAISGLGFFSASQNYGYQPALTLNGAQQSVMDGSMVGTHVLIAVLGGSGLTYTRDQFYLDGVPQPPVGTPTGTYGTANGVYNVCGAPTGYATYMNGSVYRWTAWSTQLSPSDAAAASGLTKTLAQSKGVVFSPMPSPTTTPQAVFTGDSLTNGEGVTPFVNFLSTNIAYNQVNYGIGNISAQQNMSLLPTREKPAFAPNAKSNISFVWNGTNDVATHGRTAQQAVDAILEECSLMHSFGFRTIAATTISRGSGNDSAAKNPINLLLRAQALTTCDVLADFAGNPIVGADGAYANTTYYQGDQTHLTQTGQQNIIAPMASHAIDQATGSTPSNCDPNLVSTATYTSVAADGCKLFNTASNSITDTLPSAIGYTNRVIRRCNASASGTNTLTIAAPSDAPFNNLTGSTTITVPNNTCKDFKGTLISPSAAGEFWQQLN